MNDTPAPASKPEPAQTAKAPAKATKPAASKAAIVVPAINTKPINPAWAMEVAKAHGLSGPIADAVADKLVAAVSHAIDKATKPAKLAKLVKDAYNECIG